MGEKGFKSDAEVAAFLLEKVIQLSGTNVNDKCCMVAVARACYGDQLI